MCTKLKAIGVWAFVLLNNANGGTAFCNMDFESPILPLVRDIDFNVPADKAIPDWTVYIGGNSTNIVFYETKSVGAAYVSFHDNNSLDKPIEGDFSVLMQSSTGGPATSCALGQVGTIPDGARSLQFYGSEGLEVSFGGSLIPIFVLSGGTTSYHVIAGDISMYAGQTGELRFTLPHRDTFPPYSMCWLDNIQFSTEAVPEPSTLALLGLGGLAFLARRIKKL